MKLLPPPGPSSLPFTFPQGSQCFTQCLAEYQRPEPTPPLLRHSHTNTAVIPNLEAGLGEEGRTWWPASLANQYAPGSRRDPCLFFGNGQFWCCNLASGHTARDMRPTGGRAEEKQRSPDSAGGSCRSPCTRPSRRLPGPPRPARASHFGPLL